MLKLVVTTSIHSRHNEQNIWFVFETDHESIDEFYNDLADDGCVIGVRVYTETGADGRKYVASRTDHILGLMGIATVAPCQFDYFEKAGVEA